MRNPFKRSGQTIAENNRHLADREDVARKVKELEGKARSERLTALATAEHELAKLQKVQNDLIMQQNQLITQIASTTPRFSGRPIPRGGSGISKGSVQTFDMTCVLVDVGHTPMTDMFQVRMRRGFACITNVDEIVVSATRGGSIDRILVSHDGQPLVDGRPFKEVDVGMISTAVSVGDEIVFEAGKMIFGLDRSFDLEGTWSYVIDEEPDLSDLSD